MTLEKILNKIDEILIDYVININEDVRDINKLINDLIENNKDITKYDKNELEKIRKILIGNNDNITYNSLNKKGKNIYQKIISWKNILNLGCKE